jgi:hypothetical protein
MEIVSIERKTFEELVAKFDRFVRRMDAICHRHGEKTMGKWMDNQDVCQMLNISPRMLQTPRDNGTLAYSQINQKTCCVSSPLWRTGGGKPSSKGRRYECNKQSIITIATKSEVI